MGTEKRERQKANRAQRVEQEARAASRSRYTRIGVLVVGAIAAVVVLVLAVNIFTGDDTADAPSESPTATAGDDAASPVDTVGDEDGTTGDTTEAAAGDTASAGAASEVVPDDCPPPEGTEEQTQEFDAPPPDCLDPNVEYAAQVTTNKGEFTIALDQAAAPATVNNFVFLARNRYFDDTVCHRIIPEFVIQCGDPTGTGTGDPGYQFPDELPEAGAYQIGSVAMANSGPDTNGSQFFVVTGEDGAGLQPNFSLFGQVTDGLDDAVVEIEAVGSPGGEPEEEIVIESVVIVTS